GTLHGPRHDKPPEHRSGESQPGDHTATSAENTKDISMSNTATKAIPELRRDDLLAPYSFGGGASLGGPRPIGQTVGTVVGGALGGIIGRLPGASIGSSIGGSIGGLIGSAFQSERPRV
ncbi:glycine zipper domain-containing protein, partial [Nitratireductor pacificus]|uniref:glycine zipper domain-containing protein n=1 Tax=Nitratireductor pacificus TaxID=1231180 RepID=UPI001AEBC9BE